MSMVLRDIPKLMDEPINGLDPIGIAEMRRFIRQLCDERGKTILLSSHILSEVAQLADDIGIIDNGALLEEESLQALEEKNGRYIRLGVSDAARAAQMLETEFGTDRFMVENDRSLRIFDLSLQLPQLADAVQKNGLALTELHLCEDTLEDYFKRVTGGEGIA